MTTRTITRMFVVLVAALALAFSLAEGDAAAVKKQKSERSGLAKAGSSATQHARKGKKRRGRAKKKRSKKKKKAPEKKPEETDEEAPADEAVPEAAPAGEPAAPKAGPGGVGSKLRNSAAGSSLEPAPSLGAEGVPMTAGTGLRQSNRMEFDARVVRGETAGSGAVILFERGPRHLAPLTKKRTRFLDDTIEGVLGKEESIKAREKIDRARKRKASKKEKKSEKAPTEKSEKKSESNGKSK